MAQHTTGLYCQQCGTSHTDLVDMKRSQVEPVPTVSPVRQKPNVPVIVSPLVCLCRLYSSSIVPKPARCRSLRVVGFVIDRLVKRPISHTSLSLGSPPHTRRLVSCMKALCWAGTTGGYLNAVGDNCSAASGAPCRGRCVRKRDYWRRLGLLLPAWTNAAAIGMV